MSPQQAYKDFLLDVNKNDTNGNVKVSKAQFVLLFNREKRKWLDASIKQNEDSDYIEDIQELLQLDVSLTRVSTTILKDSFTLPQDFYRRATAYTLASTDECKNQTLVVWFVKSKDINVLLQNADYSPSFNYRETLGIVNNDKFSVYKDGFTLEKVFLSYYKEPQDLDIEGYTHLDGTPSTNVETGLSNVNMEEIIARTAVIAVRNYESVGQTQLLTQVK